MQLRQFRRLKWPQLNQLMQVQGGGYQSSSGLIIKRLFDVVGSLLLLIVCLPLLMVTPLVVWASLGRPILFVQDRPGLRGELFRLYKFRTMKDLHDGHGKVLPDHLRLTRLGRFLRKLSIDELPGLFNVLRGDMSLVGPRPLLVQYLALYSPTQLRRHDVKPGITGWAQVCGRNELSWEEKFTLDLLYVENRSFWLDLRILLKTLPRVVRGTGVSPSGLGSVAYFTGSQLDQPLHEVSRTLTHET